jgi:hypothetical protein
VWRAFANSNGRARVSKDEDVALMLRDGGHSALKMRVRALGRPPQHEGERARWTGCAWRNAFTIARAEPRAKRGLRIFPVFVLLSRAKSGEPRSAARADFPFASRRLRDTRNAGLWPVAHFSPVICRNNSAAEVGFARCRNRRGSLPHAVSAGARSRD